MGAAPLGGRRVALTRPIPGRLADRLTALGAHVEHVPLIEIGEASDDGAALAAALDALDTFDWLVVTSANGAHRVGRAARHSTVRLAAVGVSTAAALLELAQRPVDLTPERQHTEGLLAVFPRGRASVLLAQGNLATDDLATGLRVLGCTVTVAEAYTTRLRPPNADALARMRGADVVVLSSGSAIAAWLAAEPDSVAAAIVAIGPKTAAFAERHGIQVAAVAAAPGDDDVISAVFDALAEPRPT